MAEKVQKVGIKRESGYMYYLDKDGDIAMVKMARAGERKGSPKKVEKTGIKKEEGYLYFIDRQGDIARAKMVRGGKKKKAKKR
ncbi:hypothetical protein B9J78_02785 [bacterium Unc6]|nr:hypothetical protein [bacterium Unc6]